jgi:hypothetical protein
MPPDPLASVAFEPGRMQRFAAAMLREAGALVDPIEPEGLEILAPPDVQRALGVGEFSRLGFGAALPPSAKRVGIEGDWLERFADLLGAQGGFTRRVLATPARAPGDPERILDRLLLLDNATFRLLNVSPAWTRILVLDFRASAVSDEKRDFLLRIAINLATGAMPDILDGPPAEEAEAPDEASLPALWSRRDLLERIGRTLPARLESALDPFIKGLRRRLGRDQDRLHGYYNGLHREALSRASLLPADDAKRAREEQRAEATAREYRAKLDDLARQYSTKVRVEWVQTMELLAPVHRFTIQIRRRKADRTILLDWHPSVRRLELPPCEDAFSTERPRLACDDALHLISQAGLAPCPACTRPYCRACHPQRCPKCGADAPHHQGILRV